MSYAKIIETMKVANWTLRRITIMDDSRDFKKEYDAFLKKVPYQTAVVDNIKVRYQYGGRDGAPVILFLTD